MKYNSAKKMITKRKFLIKNNKIYFELSMYELAHLIQGTPLILVLKTIFLLIFLLQCSLLLNHIFSVPYIFFEDKEDILHPSFPEVLHQFIN